MRYFISRKNISLKPWQLVQITLIIMGLASLSACSGQGKAAKPEKSKAPVPVKIAEVTKKIIPMEIKAIGNVEAYSVVSVRAQIGGQLTRVYFKQGDDVKKGDRLFQIDPRPLESALAQAKANLAKDQALIQQAEAKKAADQAQVKQAEAKWEADKAQIRQTAAKNSADQTQIWQAREKNQADQAQIQVAIANSQKNLAQQNQAQAQVKRYESLYKDGAISKDQYDQFRTQALASIATSEAGRSSIDNAQSTAKASLAAIANTQATANASLAAIANAQATANASKAAVENAKAAVLADQAQIDSAKAVAKADLAVLQNAQVQLSYTNIFSPIDGKTGNLLVTEGNLIRTNDSNPLVVINQVQPIYITFAIPQQKLSLVRQYMNSGELKVKAIIGKDEKNIEEGKLTFIDNAIDTTTGTVKLKATFPNSDHKLWTGQFVNVVLELTKQTDAIAVPSQAVQTGQKGQFVFLVQSDQTVKMQPVEVSRNVNGDAVISTGLAPGDQVVIDGVSRLIPGAKISLGEKGGK